ncbi:hypothetical protein GQ42DRAFT_154549 [Ramicandelaber brevisporus]|nr:hypothetical protein GQ42DRAFT_154549 [Ramicandelaber brevisporus]
MFDSDSDNEDANGTPSPGASPAIIGDCIIIITDNCTIPTSTTTNLEHDTALIPTPVVPATTPISISATHTATTSTFTSLSASVPPAASLDDSSNRETLDSPINSLASYKPQPEQQSTRSAVNSAQENISHEHIKSLFHREQMTDAQWQDNIDLVPKYLSGYHPTDSTFISNVRSLVDTSLSVLCTYTATPQPSQFNDTVPSFLHAFCMEAAPHLFSLLKHSAFLQGMQPQSALFQPMLLQVQQFIQSLFCISQRCQNNRFIVKSSNAIYNILKYFPEGAPTMIFSSLSSLSISNSDHVLGAMYILSDLEDFSKNISSSQCATASQWIHAALSMELDKNNDHAVEIITTLYWTSYNHYSINNSANSNRVIHLKPFRDFIAKHMKRSADIPIILSFYVKLAKLNFNYASTLLDQVFVELKRDITSWNRYSAVVEKINVIGDIIGLIRKSAHSDEHPQLKRLQKIIKSDAVPLVIPTDHVKDSNAVYEIWMSIRLPGTNIYKLLLHKAAQLLTNPRRDYTPEISQFVSMKKHISDVFQAVYSIARDYNHYRTPLPVQLIPHAINAICNLDIASAAKKVVCQLLNSDIHSLSLEPIAGASMDLDVENVTSSHGISSIREYSLSPALPDNIIAVINHILETRNNISMEARMNARSLIESLDQLGEALARVYHYRHPPMETLSVPHVYNGLIEFCIRECTLQVLEQHGTGVGNDVDQVADGDRQMDVMANRVRSIDVNAEMNSIMRANNIQQFEIDLADEDEDMEIDEGGDDNDNDTIVKTDVLDHSLFIKASRINQFLGSTPRVPANISDLFQHMLMYHGDTLLSDRSLCQMVLEFRPDIWVSFLPWFTRPYQMPFFMVILCLSIRVRQYVCNSDDYPRSWSNLLASVCTDNVTNGAYELMRDYKPVNVGRGQDAQFYFNVRRYAIMFESHDFAVDVAMAPSPREAVENLKALAAAIDNNGIFGRGGGWHEIDPARLPKHWENEANLVKMRVAMAMRFHGTLSNLFCSMASVFGVYQYMGD